MNSYDFTCCKLFIGKSYRTVFINFYVVWIGGSLADVIENNESQMKSMSEVELKLMLFQVSQVLNKFS